MPDTNNFNVLDMVDEVAAESNIDAADLFAQPEPVQEPVQEAVEPPKPVEEPKPEEKKKREWVPDASLTRDMP